jgi:predicted permease
VFWPTAERLTYFLLFPALLIHKLALAELGDYDAIPLTGVIVIVLLSMSLLLFLLRPALRVTGPVFSSIYQGSIRFNTYVGLAASGALFLQPGSAVAALVIAVLIPLINVLCVVVLTHAAGSKGLLALLRIVIRNPLILACVVGVFLNISGTGLPLGSGAVLDILSRAALPLGLLAVGAGLRLKMALGWSRELLLTAVLKLLALPALMALDSALVGLSHMEMAILILFAALPGAPSSYILARQLGGDAQLMAAIVTLETGLSLLTLPVILLLVM